MENALGNPILISEITKRIQKKGMIPFHEFMDIALYWPDAGYYTSDKAVWGKEGDYFTGTDVSSVFGKLLSLQLQEMWQRLGSPARFTIVEIGAGRGILSLQIKKAIQEVFPDFFSAVDFKLVDVGYHDEHHQDERLSRHSTIDNLESSVVGCIISNELIDAFPVHKLMQLEELREIYVGYKNGEFIEIVGDISDPRLNRYFERLGIRLDYGQRVVVNLQALDWMRSAASLLRQGFVVTIDYGLPAQELFHPDRAGNIMCYDRHTMNHNPYQRIGYQDITSRVDFTSLAAAGKDAGLDITGFTTQFYFLMGLGVMEQFKQMPSGRREMHESDLPAVQWNQGIKDLMLPGGMGDDFKVLIQHKGVEPPVLKGFGFKDLKRML